MKQIFAAFFFFFFIITCHSQTNDSIIIRKFFNEALSDNTAYENLEYLCTRIGGRICGSPQAENAVQWTKSVLDGMDLDTVFLQGCMVRHWVRGEEEVVIVNVDKAIGNRQKAIEEGQPVTGLKLNA